MIWLWVGIVVVALIAFVAFAHRDPDRVIARFNGYLSPADGIVVDITHVKGSTQKIPKGKHGITALLKDYPKGAVIITIMMKFWHVHTQRAPIDGKVVKVEHKEGTLKNAVFGDYMKATVENEHVAITIDGAKSCKIYLIAGLVARRIKPIATENHNIRQGDRIGKIHFGSQVAIVLPDVNVLVQKGDFVRAGLTKLAWDKNWRDDS